VGKNVIDIIYQAHHDPNAKENMIILREILPVLDRDDVWNRICPVLEFLNRYIPKHFKNEDMMIALMGKDNIFEDKESQVIHEILKEHQLLLGYFNELTKIAKNYNPFDRTVREKFIKIAQDIFDQLAVHAKKEDEVLYPIARKYMTLEKLVELQEYAAKE
jgi:hemerythrin-like domain-containing protein